MFFPMLAEFKKISPESAQDLENKYIKQREFFLKRRKKEIDALFGFKNGEEENLYGQLLLAEQDRHALENNGVWILKRLKKLPEEKEIINDHAEAKSFLGYLHIYWSITWRKFAELNKLSLAARWALNFQKKQLDNRAGIPTAEEDLIKELQLVIPSAEKFLNLPLTFKKYSELKCNKKGILELDINFLDYLKKNNLGPGSSKAIKTLTELINSSEYNLEQRKEKWDDPLFAHQNIALIRWLDRVQKYVFLKLEKPPALITPIFKQISDTMVRGLSIDKKNALMSADGKQIAKLELIPSIQLTTAQSILRHSISLLSSITAHQVVRWEFLEVHKQNFLGFRDPRKILLDGGFHTLGELIGAGTSKCIIDRLRKIIFAQSCCLFRYQQADKIWEGNLFSFQHWQARGRKSSLLEIEIKAPGCPGFVMDLPTGGIEFKEQRTLIPIVSLPDFIGRPNDHASQASFQMELFIEMRLRAKELFEHGGILITDDTWLKIAERAKMPSTLIKRVVDFWVSANYLEQTGDCMFNIGQRYPEAKKMLMQAGEAEFYGSMAGKRTSLNKKNKLQVAPKTRIGVYPQKLKKNRN